MVTKEYILKTIERLDRKYNTALEATGVQDDAKFYAKLALLEYCGWLEETFDDVVRNSIRGQLTTQPFQQMFDAIILNTSGFQYQKHFRPMLVRAIGIVSVEKLELQISQNGELDILKSQLEAVLYSRNDAAHTWIQDTTLTYPAPSLIKNRLETVFPIMQLIDGEISNL